jgi:leucyl aminopeptidase
MKKIEFVDSLNPVEVDTLILCHEEIKKEIDQILKGSIALNLQKFSSPLWITTNGAYHIPRLAMVNKKEEIELFSVDKKVAIAFENIPAEELAFYVLKKNLPAEEFVFLSHDPKNAEMRFQKYVHILEGISLAKEVIASPANLMTPEIVAKKCQQLKERGVLVDVLDEKRLDTVGAHALLAVGQGSSHAPKMVIMEWKGSEEQPLALVGKGICYDAGGINLKHAHLNEMKWDKAGAGIVIGVLDIVSRLKLPLHIVGIAVLAENMPDGNAMKPGDVIHSLGGKSIEIVDTDCEGRLALADGIAYAQKYFTPKTLIDFGTLTLETFGALGGEYAGLFCNDPRLSEQLIKAGELCGEKLWPLPLGEYYANQIRSKIADLKNEGVDSYGASSAAAEFLRAFVDPHTSWAHLDISGTSWRLDAPEKGVTGFGVELMIYYLNLLTGI